MSKIRVLVVDDSDIARYVLTTILDGDDELEVVGTAPDPYVARDKILELKPHVITLDIKMPRMDGVTFLKKLMKYHPVPVVMVSSYTQKDAEATITALELGAIDVVAKPVMDSYNLKEISAELIDKVKSASRVSVRSTGNGSRRSKPAKRISRAVSPPAQAKVIAIGASIGGTKAVREVLTCMPENAPGILVTQHMPKSYTKVFAQWLDQLCAISVKEAENGDLVVPGGCLIAPGDNHMLLRSGAGKYFVEIKDGPLVCHHKPSIEALFNSVAKAAGPNAVGVIMTGMGNDGAQGLNNMKKKGALTIAQDKNSCVVFGMPKEAINGGGVDKVLPLDKIAEAII